VDVYDEHDLHVVEHTRYLLSAEFKNAPNKDVLKQKYLAHIDEHKKMKKQA